MDFVITQLWWFVLGGFLCSLGSLFLLILIANVSVKLFERVKEVRSEVTDLTKDILDISREVGEVKRRLPSRHRMDGLMDIMTPQSPYTP